MKRLLIILILAFSALILWAGSMMSVQVSTAQLRGTPSFLGAIAAELAYGDRVEVLESGRGWFRVSTESGQSGWIQESALSSKKIVLSTGGDISSGASTEEVALAGKGFNEDVEREYRAQTDLDFTWVDRMETFGRPAEELVVFLKDGDLEGVIE